MPTFIHDYHQPWLSDEKLDMFATGFITQAEAKLLEILSGTSKCHYLPLRFFFTDSGQLLKLLGHLMFLRPNNRISASFQ
jgi:hypothetical protein